MAATDPIADYFKPVKNIMLAIYSSTFILGLNLVSVHSNSGPGIAYSILNCMEFT